MKPNGIVGRGPLSSGPASEAQEAFAEEVLDHLSPAARSRIISFAEGGTGTLYVNYFNVPSSAIDGADRENNRLMITVEGFGRGDKLKTELRIRFAQSTFGDPKYKLRAKSASAPAIARYVADYINLCAESEPKVRYSSNLSPDLRPNRGVGPEGGGRGVPQGSRIDWRFKGRDTTQMLFVTKEPDDQYYLWHEAYGKKPDWTYSFAKKSEAIAALNEQAGHSHRPNVGAELEPNRYLTRFQLERMLRESGSYSNADISRMTDDQLRRAVGHDRLVEAGDINRNGPAMNRNPHIETDTFEAFDLDNKAVRCNNLAC